MLVSRFTVCCAAPHLSAQGRSTPHIASFLSLHCVQPSRFFQKWHIISPGTMQLPWYREKQLTDKGRKETAPSTEKSPSWHADWNLKSCYCEVSLLTTAPENRCTVENTIIESCYIMREHDKLVQRKYEAWLKVKVPTRKEIPCTLSTKTWCLYAYTF